MKHLRLLPVLLLLVSSAHAQTVNGTLSMGDPQREGSIYYDPITFQVDYPTFVTVRMQSDAFDTYLVVKSPSGSENVNDDFEGQTVSQVELLATEPGTWTVWASAYGTGMEGAYTVTIEKGSRLEVETIEGRLDYRDQVALKGEYYDTIVKDLVAGSNYVFELVSLGYDGYLVVTSPSGEVWRNDDAGSTRLSRVGPVSGPTGKWTIQVTSVSAAETGAYDLNVVRIQGN